MKFHVTVLVSLMSLAPALAKSVPQGVRPLVPSAKLGYNAADPNLMAHMNSRTGSSALTPAPAAIVRQAAVSSFPLQNLGVVQGSLGESRPAPGNTFFTFPRSTNPVLGPTSSFEQKKAK